MSMTIEAATAADYTAFTALFPELATNDPVPSLEKWTKEIAPAAFFVRDGDAVAGYAFFNLLDGVGYVRHVIVAPAFRGRRIGRVLMDELARRFREGGAARWCLNVKPGNEPAVVLYRSVGMTRAYASAALGVKWDAVARLPAPPLVEARPVLPADDAAVERAFSLPKGQVADARKAGTRLLIGLFEANAPVGYAAFDPSFPGAFPFRLARPELARALLEALSPHRRPEHEGLGLVVEDDPALERLLLGAGATVRMQMEHWEGALPSR